MVSHKGTPTSTLLKHSLRVLLLGNKVPSADSTMVTLILISTKELLHKGWGSPRPPHKVVHAAPHQVGGSLTLPASHQCSKGAAHRDTMLVHSRTTAQGTTHCSLSHLRANLAHSQNCAKDKRFDHYALGWLGGVLGCGCDVLKLQQS